MRLTTEVDVDVDDFDPEDILDAACHIIKQAEKSTKYKETLKEGLQHLRAALLGLEAVEPEPETTACQIKSAAELRKYVEEHSNLLRWAQ